MRVVVGGPFATMLPDGTVFAPVPGSTLDVPDDDPALLTHWRGLVAGGLVTELVEPVANVVPQADPEPDTEVADRIDMQLLRGHAEALGIRVDGRWKAERLRTEINRVISEREKRGDDKDPLA